MTADLYVTPGEKPQRRRVSPALSWPVDSQCRLAYFDHAAVLIFCLVRMGLASLMVAGASWRVPCWPCFLTG